MTNFYRNFNQNSSDISTLSSFTSNENPNTLVDVDISYDKFCSIVKRFPDKREDDEIDSFLYATR